MDQFLNLVCEVNGSSKNYLFTKDPYEYQHLSTSYNKHAKSSQPEWLTRIEYFSYLLQRRQNIKNQCLFYHTSGLRNLGKS